MRDLDQTIQATRKAVDSTPEGHPDRVEMMLNLGTMLTRRYGRMGDPQDLDEAIQATRQVVTLTPEGHPDRGMLLNLGTMLALRFERTRNMQDLDEAIQATRQAVELTLDDHPRARVMSNLGAMLTRRYEQTENVQDIEEAIQTARQAVKLTLGDHSDRIGMLLNLGMCLARRYGRVGDMQDLEEAIRMTRRAIESTPEDNPDLVGGLNNLGANLETRYRQKGEIKDLDEAIRVSRRAVKLTPKGHPDRAGRLDNLGNALETRYTRMGEVQDLDEAIQVIREAVESGPKAHPHYVTILIHLGIALESRYKRTGDIQNIEEAIQVTREAVHSTPKGHPDRAGWLTDLGTKLASRYKRTGNIQDLEEAIQNTQEAIESTSKDYLIRMQMLTNMGLQFNARFERTGELQNLEEAIQVTRQAIESTPEDHPDRAEVLSNLGIWLNNRYNRTRSMQNLDEAIQMTKQAINSTPNDHPRRAGILNNLGLTLASRFGQTGDTRDLDEAIRVTRQAIKSTPKDHPNRAGYLNNLGNELARRYEQTKKMQELDEAIQVSQEAVDLTPDDHANRAVCLNILGEMLERRYAQDRKAALECFVLSSQCSQARPLTRIYTARKAIRILQDQKDWEKAASLAIDALKLLPLVCGRYLRRDDQQYAIVQSSGLAADACSLSLKTGHVEQALQQLEFGRGLILGYTIDNRTDLSALKEDYPALAERYETLRFKASRQIDAQAPVLEAQLLKERREAVHEIEDCLSQIRQLAGHGRFLLEPTITELKSQATEGPIVVVNVTDIGSDGIILWHDRIKALPLPGLSSQKAPRPLQQDFERYTLFRREYYQRDIASEEEVRMEPDQLSWLWSNCVKLIFDELEVMGFFPSSVVPRMWWVGSGIAGSFPFHAAGAYFGSSMESTLNRVIPSYTPTIKTLIYSRSRASKWAGPDNKSGSVLVVTMPTTPGQKLLSGVEREAEVIEKACRGTYLYEKLQLPGADKVLEKISTSDIIHFACHGISDRINPSESHLLLLRDGQGGQSVDQLTVSRISTVATQGRAWIAFLSACSTAEVKVAELADEGLHLASAFQVAGFAHVIGSLWSADDDACVRVAEIFYSDLIQRCQTEFSNRSIAAALRNAVMQVRSDFPQRPHIWAPFVHFGA